MPPSLKHPGNREKVVRMIADWMVTPIGEPLIIEDGLTADEGAFIAKAAILFPGELSLIAVGCTIYIIEHLVDVMVQYALLHCYGVDWGSSPDAVREAIVGIPQDKSQKNLTRRHTLNMIRTDCEEMCTGQCLLMLLLSTTNMPSFHSILQSSVTSRLIVRTQHTATAKDFQEECTICYFI